MLSSFSLSERQLTWSPLALFLTLRPAPAAAVAKMIIGRLLIALGLWRRRERRSGDSRLLDRLGSWTGGASGNEGRKSRRGFFDRVHPGLRLFAKVSRRLIAARRALVERPPVLTVAIIELTILPRPAVLLLLAGLIAGLPLRVRLRTAVVRL